MTLPVVRKVDNLERYSLARGNAGTYYNVIVGTHLKLQSKDGQQLPKDSSHWVDLLTGPLTWLIGKHPTLSVVIGDHLSPNPMFLRMPSVDLTKVIRVTSIDEPDDIAKVFEEEHAVPFDNSNFEVPLWRIVVAHVKNGDSFYLLYVFQHTIGDGRSALSLTEQLVERLNIEAVELNIAESKSSDPTTVISPNDPLPLPLEKRANCNPGLFTLIKGASMALLLPSFLKKAIESKYWSGEFDATLESHETRAGIWKLTKEETTQVIQAAKAHKTTVNSILVAASCFALKAVFLTKVGNDSKPTTTDDKFLFSTPVALRKLISPPVAQQDQGCYTSEWMTKDIQIDLNTEFWGLTTRYHQDIIKGTKTSRGVKGMLQHVGLLKYVPNHPGGWEEFLREQVTKEQHGRAATLTLSNIGKGWDQAQDVPFKIQDTVFSQSSGIAAAAVTLGASTANSILTVTGTWQKATFSSCDRPRLYMSEYKRILLDVTSPNRGDYHLFDAVLLNEPKSL
ncbi:hypothetical protein BGZ76_007765 [Entomortierella beljakovae]|nr:hypothetical protein BGZ76_007765 [Entomortierella beljakovae]